MKECRYCQKPLKDEESICTFCGYDYKTGAINQSLKPKISPGKKINEKEKKAQSREAGVNPRIKNFAFIGLGIVMFSIFYKYNFNIDLATSEIKYLIAKLKTNRFVAQKIKTQKEKSNKPMELLNVESFDGSKKISKSKEPVVEGIVFNPEGKSFIIINGNVVSEGEAVDNITVKKINKSSAELIIDGESKVVEVK